MPVPPRLQESSSSSSVHPQMPPPGEMLWERVSCGETIPIRQVGLWLSSLLALGSLAGGPYFLRLGLWTPRLQGGSALPAGWRLS